MREKRPVNWDRVSIPADTRFLLNDRPWGLDVYLGPMRCVVDIGAHCGLFSLCAAEYGAEMVLAFEPEPTNFRLLLENIDLQELSGVIVPVPCAVSRESFQFVNFGRYPQSGMNSLVYTNMDRAVKTRTVGIIDLINVVSAKYGCLDYMKMDVEGAEYMIFQDSPDLREALKKLCVLDLDVHTDESGSYFTSKITAADVESLICFFESCGFRRANGKDPRSHYFYNDAILKFDA